MTIAQAIYTAFARHYRRWANRAVLQAAIARLHEVEPMNTEARALAEHTLERMASVCEGLEVPEIVNISEQVHSIEIHFERRDKRLTLFIPHSGYAPSIESQQAQEGYFEVDEIVGTDEQLAALWRWYKE